MLVCHHQNAIATTDVALVNAVQSNPAHAPNTRYSHQHGWCLWWWFCCNHSNSKWYCKMAHAHKRQGSIERTHIALLQSLLIMLLIETCVKPVCCGVGSVSWAIFGQGFYQMPIKVYLTLWNVHVENLFDFVIINKLIRTSLPLPSWTRFDLYQYIIVNKQFLRFFWFTSCT